jgi:hypothetical protein
MRVLKKIEQAQKGLRTGAKTEPIIRKLDEVIAESMRNSLARPANERPLTSRLEISDVSRKLTE